jgi:hypothetical protein
MPLITPVTIAAAANATYTPAQLLGGWINRDCNGGARTDTLPTAAAMCEAVQGAMVGTAFDFEIRNTTSTAVAVTLAAGAGGTLSPAATTVAQLATRTLTFIFTNVQPGLETYTVWSRGAGTF